MTASSGGLPNPFQEEKEASLDASGECSGMKQSGLVRGCFKNRSVGRRPCRSLVAVLAALLVVMGSATGKAEDFSTPVEVTQFGGDLAEVAMSVDSNNTISMVSVSGTKLRIDLLGSDLRASVAMPGPAATRSSPGVVNNSLGETFVSFSEEVDDGDRDVFLTSYFGGRFGGAVNLSNGEHDNISSRLVLDRTGGRHVVWNRLVQAAPNRVVYHRQSTGETLVLAIGLSPSIAVDTDNTVYVAYPRGADVYFRTRVAGEDTFEQERLAVATPAALGVEDVRLAADDNGNVYLLLTNDGKLSLAVSEHGSIGFDPSRDLDSGGVSEPAIHVQGGQVGIVYRKGGEVITLYGVPAFFGSLITPEPAELNEPGLSAPLVIVDNCLNLHLAFENEGETYYTNNAGAPEPDFSSDLVTGDAELTVRFEDTSTGKVQAKIWEFGDGCESTQSNPSHTYDFPGVYTVTLTVFNADKQASLTKKNFIDVLVPSNRMSVPELIEVLPGERDVTLPVFASNGNDIQGFQVNGRVDRRFLRLGDCSQMGTVVEALEPDVWECDIHDDNFAVGVAFELEPPFKHPVLEPGEERILVNFTGDVPANAPQGQETDILLFNDSSVSPVDNIFVVDTFTVRPYLTSGKLRVKERPLLAFIRGDADNNGDVDITDAIVILGFLFLGGDRPFCMDAADVNDAGRVDISSAINVLGFLFQGSPPPSLPFPISGFDPTDNDSLEPCYANEI